MNRAQRIGRWVLVLLLMGALAGLVGGGPLSRTESHDGGGRVLLRFDRFARATAAQELQLQIRGGEPGADVVLSVDTEFLRRVRIESIRPEPAEQTASAEKMLMTIHLNSREAFMVVRYRPLRPGWLEGRIGVGESRASFKQFVYP